MIGGFFCKKIKIVRSITLSTLRKNLKKHFDYVSKSLGVIIVPGNKGTEAVVIMPISEYNSLLETEHLLSTNANRKRLFESIDQIAQGKLFT